MRPLALVLLLGPLQGCVLNSVMPVDLSERFTVGPYRGVAVYGVGVEGSWKSPEFSVILDEYDPERRRITGNCLFYNRMEARVPGETRQVRRFAFDVPAGYYAFSGFNGAGLSGGPVAFEVPEGSLVYLGDFVFTDERGVELRRPNTNLPPAKSMPTGVPQVFLCAP